MGIDFGTTTSSVSFLVSKSGQTSGLGGLHDRTCGLETIDTVSEYPGSPFTRYSGHVTRTVPTQLLFLDEDPVETWFGADIDDLEVVDAGNSRGKSVSSESLPDVDSEHPQRRILWGYDPELYLREHSSPDSTSCGAWFKDFKLRLAEAFRKKDSGPRPHCMSSVIESQRKSLRNLRDKQQAAVKQLCMFRNRTYPNRPLNDKEEDEITVFLIETFLTFLLKHAWTFIVNQGYLQSARPPSHYKVRICLAIPPVWDGPAKRMMQKAAAKAMNAAGFNVAGDYIPDLQFVSEPFAALVSVINQKDERWEYQVRFAISI
jgi:molecular chaperone DnaK (HSP70)